MRTKGEWEIIGITNIRSKKTHEHIVQCFDKDDLKFIAMCGTIANRLDEQKIDGEKAIEMLPEIICLLKQGIIIPNLLVWNIEHILPQLQLKQPERKEEE